MPPESKPLELSSTEPRPSEQPGYGEEPDTAALPDSFEDDAINDENGGDDSFTPYGQDVDRPHSTASNAIKDEPLQMKEDG